MQHTDINESEIEENNIKIRDLTMEIERLTVENVNLQSTISYYSEEIQKKDKIIEQQRQDIKLQYEISKKQSKKIDDIINFTSEQDRKRQEDRKESDRKQNEQMRRMNSTLSGENYF